MSRGTGWISHCSVQTSDYLPGANSQIKLRQARGGKREVFWPRLSLTGFRITPPSAQQTLHTLTTPTHPSSLMLCVCISLCLSLPKHADSTSPSVSGNDTHKHTHTGLHTHVYAPICKETCAYKQITHANIN